MMSFGLISMFAAGFFPSRISCTFNSALLNCPVGSTFAPGSGISPLCRGRVTVRIEPAVSLRPAGHGEDFVKRLPAPELNYTGFRDCTEDRYRLAPELGHRHRNLRLLDELLESGVQFRFELLDGQAARLDSSDHRQCDVPVRADEDWLVAEISGASIARITISSSGPRT